MYPKLPYNKFVNCLTISARTLRIRLQLSTSMPLTRAARLWPRSPRRTANALHHSTQSAIKMFVSCGAVPFRLDAHTRCLPSELNIGNASKPGYAVTRSSPVPSSLMTKRSKPEGSFCAAHVRSENDALPVRQPVRREIRGAVVRHLMFVRAVGIHHPDFQVARANQTLARADLCSPRFPAGVCGCCARYTIFVPS